MSETQHLEARADDIRRRLRSLLNSVERDHAHVTIKRYDEDTAVIVPVAWYERSRALRRGVLAFIRDADCHWLPGETELPVGELLAAIGPDVIGDLDKEDC